MQVQVQVQVQVKMQHAPFCSNLQVSMTRQSQPEQEVCELSVHQSNGCPGGKKQTISYFGVGQYDGEEVPDYYLMKCRTLSIEVGPTG